MAKIHETKIKITTQHKKAVTGLKKVRAAAGKLVPSFNQVRNMMLLSAAAVAGLTVAIFALVKSAAKAGDEFDKMSKRLDVSAQTLSELKFAAELSGASIDDIEKSMKKLSKSAVDADRGLLTYKRAFDELGVSITDTDGKLKDTETLFNEVSQALVGLESNTKKTALAQELFGKSGTKLLPLFREGADGIAALREEARFLGITYSDEAAAGAAAFVDAQQRLTDSFKGVKIGIAEDLQGPLTNFFNNTSTLIAENRGEIIAMAKDWATAIGGMAQSVLVGGAEVIDFLSKVAKFHRQGEIEQLRFELQNLQLEVDVFERMNQSIPAELQAKIVDIAVNIAELEGKQIISEDSASRAERIKTSIAEIQEMLIAAETSAIIPRTPGEEEGDIEGLEGPKVAAAQREIDQLNAMWDAQFLTESERLDMWYGEQLQKADDNFGQRLTLEQIYLSKKQQLIDKDKKAKDKIDDLAKKKRKADFKDFVGNLQAAGQQSQVAFEAWKLGAIAQAVITTITGTQEAWRSGMQTPGPWAPVVAAAYATAAFAAGTARVSAIRSTSYSGGGGAGGGGTTSTVGGFALPAQPLLPEVPEIIPEELTRGQTTINIYPQGNLIDMSGVMDELAPFLEESITDKVVDIHVS